jgi:predicted nucleic acid-binding protein
MAVCPITELGFLRISTHPKGLNSDMAGARRLLSDFLFRHEVEFIPCDLPGLESRAAKSDGVTDLYLADLASRKGMTLATLDTGIVHPAVEIL